MAQLVKKFCLQCGRPGFSPWVGKIPWRRERLPTPVFWPGEFHGVWSMGSQSDTTARLSLTHSPHRTVEMIEWAKAVKWFVHCCSVAQLCLTLCDPMDCSTPGFPVLHHLLELAQTHVHWVGDAIQLSHPLLPPFPFAFYLSQHQSLFDWVGSSHQVAKVLELQFHHQYFQWVFRILQWVFRIDFL